MGATFTASAVFKAVDKVSAVMGRMGNATKSFAQRTQIAFGRIEAQSRRLNQRFSKMLGVVGKLGLGFSALMIAQNIATANVELDQSLASLQAITGATSAEMVGYAKQLEIVSKNQKVFGAETGKVFELVGSAKPELLANAEALGKVSEQAIILSKAGKLEITDSVNALTSSLNQFGRGAEFAAKFTDVLATAQQKGSGNIRFLSEAMVIAGSTSRAFGNSFEDTVAILEGFAKAGLPASKSGTALSSIISKLAKATNKDFNPQFTKATDIINNLAKANLKYTDLVGLVKEENAKYLQAIINQNAEVQRLTGNLHESNNAQKQAAIQTFTLGQLWKQVTASFKNATTTTDTNSKAILKLKENLIFLAENMDKIISLAVTAIKVFLIYKAVVIVAAVANQALIAALAIAKFAQFIKIIFLMAKAKGIWTAAQWALNVALNANPIGLIVVAIIALIAVVTIIIKKWETWGAAISIFLGPIGMIIAMVQSFRKHWDEVKASFASGGILSGLLTIGKVLLDVILYPVQQLLELLGKIPGLDIATTGAAKLEAFRGNLFAYEQSLLPEKKEQIQTTNTTIAQENIKREERISRQESTLNIKNNSSLDLELDNPMGADITLTPTN